jgi:hypothetical protein
LEGLKIEEKREEFKLALIKYCLLIQNFNFKSSILFQFYPLSIFPFQ